MIVPGQQNLKVHYAGLEKIIYLPAKMAAGVNYGLFTVFPFISEVVGVKSPLINFGLDSMSLPRLFEGLLRHVIMDSGLFTLMFGAYKGDKDEPVIRRWFDALVQFVHESQFTGTCVEVDCQKVLNPAIAWELREKLRTALPNNRIINVFHIEDGQAGLDQMIEFSDYIAISIPELRHAGKKRHAEAVANYIKNKKPEIDIHLLGCTEKKLLKALSFCSSSDSTSWISSRRYGFVETEQGKFHVSKFDGSKLEEAYLEKVRQAINKLGISINNIQPLASTAFAAEHLKYLYATLAGDQS